MNNPAVPDDETCEGLNDAQAAKAKLCIESGQTIGRLALNTRMNLRNLVFWTGFALALPQALWVRSRATRFADASGETCGSIAGTAPKRLIAIGDSIIAGVGCRTLKQACAGQTAAALAQELQTGIEWQAIGKTGTTTRQILKQLVPRLPDEPADFILISAGVNDITGLNTLNQWSEALTALLDALQAHSPDALIALAGIPPMHCFPRVPQPLRTLFGLRAQSFDKTARQLVAPLNQVVYVPFETGLRPDQFAPDGYHPSEASCQELGQTIAQAFCAIVAH